MKTKKRVAPVVTEKKPEPTAVERIKLARESIEWMLSHKLRRCKEIKEKFLAEAGKDLLYSLRYMETPMLNELEFVELYRLEQFYREKIDGFAFGVAFVLRLLKEEQTDKLNRLLESPYRHNSTCAISNFYQECELRAKADFWRNTGFSKGFAAEIIRELEKWLAAEKEMEEVYNG